MLVYEKVVVGSPGQFAKWKEKTTNPPKGPGCRDGGNYFTGMIRGGSLCGLGARMVIGSTRKET